MPITEEVRARILELARGGMSCNGIAREVGVSPSTVSRAAKKAGVSFDRAQTAKAVEAAKVDVAALRAELALELLQDIRSTMTGMREGEPPASAMDHERKARGLAALSRAFSDVVKVPDLQPDPMVEIRAAFEGFDKSLKEVFGDGDDGYGSEYVEPDDGVIAAP